VARVAGYSIAFIENAAGRKTGLSDGTWRAGERRIERMVDIILKSLSIFLAIHILIGFWRFKVFDEYLAAFAALAVLAICFFSPVFHPWYFVGVMPLFAGLKREEWISWAAVIFAVAGAMNVIHIAGDANQTVRILSAVLIVATVILFFWRFRSRFLEPG
jgi:ABC-type Fe3+-siderophore transport system permease subunit